MMDAEAKNLSGLEILRLVSALAVVIYHYPDYFALDNLAPRPLSDVLWPLYGFGQFAVPVFWTLSGYVFFWKYEKPIAARTISGWQFSILRFSRLYPLHLVTLALVAALYPFSDARWWPYAINWRALIAQLFFASNWFTPQYSFNGPIWSVSIEVLVYAGFFALARRAHLSSTAALPAVIAASGGAYWLIAHTTVGPLGMAALQIASCSTCFFSGALLAKLRNIANAPYRTLAAAAAAAAAALFLIRPTYALTFALPIAAVFVFSAGALWRTRPMRLLARAGDLTYASYLLHFPIAAALRLTGIAQGAVQSPLFLGLYIAAVLGAAAACFFYFERPLQTVIRGRAGVLKAPKLVLGPP